MHLAAHGLQHSCRTDGARAGSHRNSPGSKNAARRWYCQDRVMHVSSALEKYFCDNPEGDVYRASNGEYLPGPAESVSIALVDGISPADFRNRVRTELTYVEGWKKQPNAVLRRMIDQAEAWKIVEAHGSSSGGSGGAARSGACQEKKQSAKGLTCHKCGLRSHSKELPQG